MRRRVLAHRHQHPRLARRRGCRRARSADRRQCSATSPRCSDPASSPRSAVAAGHRHGSTTAMGRGPKAPPGPARIAVGIDETPWPHPDKIDGAVAVQIDHLARGIGEAADVDALLPPRIVAGAQGDQVGIGRIRPRREGVRADDDPVIAEPQDRGKIVGGSWFSGSGTRYPASSPAGCRNCRRNWGWSGIAAHRRGGRRHPGAGSPRSRRTRKTPANPWP